MFLSPDDVDFFAYCHLFEGKIDTFHFAIFLKSSFTSLLVVFLHIALIVGLLLRVKSVIPEMQQKR